MPTIACPPNVRGWFRSSRSELETQLIDLFSSSAQDVPPAVAVWVVRFAHTHLLPNLTVTGETAVDQKRTWVCFAIRHLHPLLTNAPKLVSHEATANIVKNHYAIVQTLIEGDADAVLQVLRETLTERNLASDDEADYPADLDRIADREERTFARSADRGRDQVIAALTAYLAPTRPNPAAESLRTYLSSKRPEQVHRALQDHHRRYSDLIRQSENHPELQHDLEVSLREFERRLDMIDEFRTWDSRVLVGAEMVMVIAVLGMDITARTALLLILILGFLIACLFYTRTTYAITDADSWAEKELRLLRARLGNETTW
jgi:hypothetical protein